MGPLAGLKVIELAGLGPAPFCGMMLGDLGADVVRVDRVDQVDLGIEMQADYDLRNRNKRSIALDLKSAEDLGTLMGLVEKADILIEGFRPGVAEKLKVGPQDCWHRNPRLVYGRATGWGQEGPLAKTAGHDINYMALTGALERIGPADSCPVPPLNLVGDYGGGGMYMAFGLLAALYEVRQSGKGQVVDCAIIDGVTSLMTVFHGLRQLGQIDPRRGANILDGGAPFYRCYRTQDDKYMAVGAIETRFYNRLINVLGLAADRLPDRGARENWPALTNLFAGLFLSRTRDEWEALFAEEDACVSPVLSMEEARDHPHNKARDMLTIFNGVEHPQPAPRFSRTPGCIVRAAPIKDQHTHEILHDWEVKERP